ncbi:MAG: Drug resistance transporter, EmrB/QacA subfamily [Microgenomates group bacterium GW2011_GWA2_46_7]|nr:MAG: Drug resistance transporter, EmrB/QacA subfamily [Microgenomates group bacterium GW2011_GWA2_46_7]
MPKKIKKIIRKPIRKTIKSTRTSLVSTKQTSNKNLYIIGAMLTVAALGYFTYRSLFRPQTIDINQITGGTGTVTLALTPATSTQASNTTRNVTLEINAGTKHVSGAQIEITFDSTKCVTPIVTAGTFLTGNPLVPVNVANGKITFTYAAPPASGGATGNGTLATITTGPKSAACSLVFTPNTYVTTTENLTGNSLASASDAVISLPGAPSPTPTLTPSSSPNPSPTPSLKPCASKLTPAQCQEYQSRQVTILEKVQQFNTCRETHGLSYCYAQSR